MEARLSLYIADRPALNIAPSARADLVSKLMANQVAVAADGFAMPGGRTVADFLEAQRGDDAWAFYFAQPEQAAPSKPDFANMTPSQKLDALHGAPPAKL